MFSIALRSLRFRAGAFAASFINVFLGAAILMSFASLLDSAGGAGVSPADKNTLTTMALVIGGWGLLIVAFGVAATSNLSVRQRSTEIALLKSAGAEPRQIGRMILSEVTVISVVAALLAIPVAFLAGRACLAALQATHQVAGTVAYHVGMFALSVGLGDVVLAAAIAAGVAAHRAASLNTREALSLAATGERRMSRRRIVFACLFLLAGTDCGVLSATVFANQGFVTESLAGEACIHTSIGFALFAPALMRAAAWLLGAPLQLVSRVSGYLAGSNVRQRPDQSASVLMPVILFIGLAAGSLYLQSVQDNANTAAHIVQGADEKGVETLNFIVVAMIAVFAAVVLINVAVATTSYRRREFGQERLVGATPSQVLRMVWFESATTLLAGIVLGTAGALAGVVPYSIARTHSAVPHAGLGIYAGVVATVVVVTAAATLGATAWAMRRPAIEAATLNV
jgi:putative ABC transport system permease protein